MVTRSIRLWPDPVLSQMCTSVDPAAPDLPTLIDDLFDTMYGANGRGLAAPQVGVLSRVFVVDVTWKEGTYAPQAFINPVVVATSEDIVLMDEQCLSIPNLPMSVQRPKRVKIRWLDRNGATQTAWFDGSFARCIQHEFDHLNGTVIFDHQPQDIRVKLETEYAP